MRCGRSLGPDYEPHPRAHCRARTRPFPQVDSQACHFYLDQANGDVETAVRSAVQGATLPPPPTEPTHDRCDKQEGETGSGDAGSGGVTDDAAARGDSRRPG